MSAERLERLERLRTEARQERASRLERFTRAGGDPAEFFADEPSIDDVVVSMMLADALLASGRSAEHSLARLAGLSARPDAAVHRRNADELERALLFAIGRECEELAVAVWAAIGARGG